MNLTEVHKILRYGQTWYHGSRYNNLNDYQSTDIIRSMGTTIRYIILI